MRLNPKGAYFWGGLFAAAACVAIGKSSGAVAFVLVSLLVYILG